MRGRKPKPLTNSVELDDTEIKLLVRCLTLGISCSYYGVSRELAILKEKLENIQIQRLERTNPL